MGHHRLTNYKIVSQIRCKLASLLDINKTEKVLFSYWSGFIKTKRVLLPMLLAIKVKFVFLPIKNYYGSTSIGIMGNSKKSVKN